MIDTIDNQSILKLQEEIDFRRTENVFLEEVSSLEKELEEKAFEQVDKLQSQYSKILTHFSSDKVIRSWYAPRKNDNALVSLSLLEKELTKLAEVVQKNSKKCFSCNQLFVFECSCIKKKG